MTPQRTLFEFVIVLFWRVCATVVSEVPPTVGIFVLSISVNHHLVIRVAVAPMFFTNILSHFLSVVPKSSVSSVSLTSEVLIATPERLERAVLAHEAGISEVRAIVPVVAGAVSTTPVPATAFGWIVTSPEVLP